MTQIADATLQSRLNADLADTIAQRALLSLAMNAGAVVSRKKRRRKKSTNGLPTGHEKVTCVCSLFVHNLALVITHEL